MWLDTPNSKSPFDSPETLAVCCSTLSKATLNKLEPGSESLLAERTDLEFDAQRSGDVSQQPGELSSS